MSSNLFFELLKNCDFGALIFYCGPHTSVFRRHCSNALVSREEKGLEVKVQVFSEKKWELNLCT